MKSNTLIIIDREMLRKFYKILTHLLIKINSGLTLKMNFTQSSETYNNFTQYIKESVFLSIDHFSNRVLINLVMSMNSTQ
jgi:hypothetical protein